MLSSAQPFREGQQTWTARKRLLVRSSNSLPIRVAVTAGVSLSEFAGQLHKQLLELSEFQYSSLMQVQGWSEVPWRERLFESLVVFQNYRVHESARQMGGSVVIR